MKTQAQQFVSLFDISDDIYTEDARAMLDVLAASKSTGADGSAEWTLADGSRIIEGRLSVPFLPRDPLKA